MSRIDASFRIHWQAITMSPSRLVLHIPASVNQRVALAYLPHPPSPVGRRLPNGTIIVTDDAFPSLLYKFSPWKNSLLAFNEVDTYSRLYTIEDPSGIVQLEGVSGTEDHFVRVLERSHAGPLDRFLLDKARGDRRLVETELTRSILAQIAESMANIHSLNIIHRDLKAENILMFDEDPDAGNGRSVRPKVADFDRAVELSDGEFLQEPVGSVFHMAPELLAWQKYSRKVDVYAFGILMFEVAHGGARPHSNVATSMPGAITRAEFADKVVNEELRPNWLHEDEALKHLASRCWATNPDDRPEFQEIVELLKAGSPRHKSLGQAALEKQTRREHADIDGVGTASDIGKVRTSMEDAVCVLKTPDALVACVFDGLRGPRTSAFSARRFAMALIDELTKNAEDGEAAVRHAFKIVDAALRTIEPPIECGSTAVVALLRDNDLLVSWLGDSPAYLFRKTDAGTGHSAVPLVDRHHPGRDDEAARIAANGGVVHREQRWLDSGEAVPWGPLRVFVPDVSRSSGISLSRALGLFPFRPAIGDEPETVRLERQGDDLFLVLGSDGVFDVLDTEAAYQIVAAAGSAQYAADAVIDTVLKNGAPDNASVVVIDMRR
ncbi:bifunctional serine/threonine-protein kinase/phosphatase [Pseudochelatococcus sp. B33]